MQQYTYYVINNILLIAGCVGGILATVWGFWAGWKKVLGKDEEKLDKIRQELVDNLQANCEAWKSKYETEHEEHKGYREYSHGKLNDAQLLISKANLENQDLKAKTNIVPIMDALKEVAEVMKKVAEIMERLEQRLDIFEKTK